MELLLLGIVVFGIIAAIATITFDKKMKNRKS